MYCIRFQKQQTQKVFSSANFFRLIETDAKSLNSLSCQGSGHSRRSSETSQISITSGSMMSDQFQENAEEDLWVLWGKIINEWETWSKKKQPQLKVKVTQINQVSRNQLHSTEFFLSIFEFERPNIADCCKQTFCFQFSSKVKHDFSVF